MSSGGAILMIRCTTDRRNAGTRSMERFARRDPDDRSRRAVYHPSMLTHEHMMERFYARDRESDGRFLTGVLTTGIYCLPSCTARKPLPQNVRFFDSEDSAREAGLRPCRRCRPDHFYQQYDPGTHLVETLAAEVRAAPARFADAAALAVAAGVGSTTLNALFRRHLHLSPAAFLARERVDAAQRALADGVSVADAGFAAGFESLSAFHENFRRLTGLTPGDYRALGDAPEVAMALPEGFRADVVLAYFGRDPASAVERVRGSEIAKGVWLGDAPARLHLRFADDRVLLRVNADRTVGREEMRAAHRTAVRMLGLASDPAAFERHAARRADLAPVVAGRRGLRIPLTASPWECLVWAIVGQQVNLPFAYALRNAVAQLAGEDAGDGLRAHPTPAAVAALDYGDLTALRFSRSKAEYLIDVAREIEAGRLRMDAEERPLAPSLERRLLAVRGLGPWSARYLMMRGYGFADCVPVGDAGLSAALTRFLSLDHRPAGAEMERWMEPFAPFRSLATYHLWASLGDPQ